MLAKYMLVVFLALAIAGIITAQRLGTSAINQADQPSLKSQFTRLNSYSRSARNKRDNQSTKAFTDAVIDTFVPPNIASDVLKDRLFALEREEREAGKIGITEASLARGINSFAVRIGAPEFAQTSTLQIRVFRAKLRFMLPDVIAPALSQKPVTRDAAIASIPNEIGPAEASVVIATLLSSKLHNEDLQIPPAEWGKAFLAKRQQSRQNQLSALPTAQRGDSPPEPTHTLRALSPTPSSNDLQGSLQTFGRSLESVEAVGREIDRFIGEIRNE